MLPLSPKAQRTRRTILEASKKIIIDEGLNALSMDRVSAVAKLSKGAVMYHFHSKRALIRALFQDYADHLDAELREHEALFDGTSDETLVPAYVDWFKDFVKDDKGWATVGMLLLPAYCYDDEIMAPVREWYRNIYARIEAMPVERRARTVMAIMMLEGFFNNHKLGIDLLSPAVKEETWSYVSNDFLPKDAKRKGQPEVKTE